MNALSWVHNICIILWPACIVTPLKTAPVGSWYSIQSECSYFLDEYIILPSFSVIWLVFCMYGFRASANRVRASDSQIYLPEGQVGIFNFVEHCRCQSDEECLRHSQPYCCLKVSPVIDIFHYLLTTFNITHYCSHEYNRSIFHKWVQCNIIHELSIFWH